MRVAMPLSGSEAPRVLIESPSREVDAKFSPDGRWLAYTSDESGRFEIYLRAFKADAEVELWAAPRQRRTTVLGSTSKRAALQQADRVVVLADGRVAAIGPWSELAAEWGHLAG